MEGTRLELLQQMPIFGGIRADVLEYLLTLSHVVPVRDGVYFFRENDPGTSLFVLETGRVAVLKLWKGQEYLLRHLEKGDCFGEMAVIDLFPRSASVLAVEDSSAIEISTACLNQIRKKDLMQFTLIQMNMGREVSRRLRQADERLFAIEVEGSSLTSDLFHHT